MIFVDTGAWFSAFVPWDVDHSAAVAWFLGNQEPLLTTDFVVDETLTLLRSRGERSRALALCQRFFDGSLATLHFLTEDDLRDASDVFRRYSDKDWSFTDCSSKVVVERLGIKMAFAFDRHFLQFGTVVVVP